MLFNSIDFAIFLPIVFVLYWFVTKRNFRLQNLLIVLASYVFYGWWDWRFLSLIFFSTIVDYTVGLNLLRQENPSKRKALLLTSIVVNLGFLGFFKYFNFFVDNFVAAFSFLGADLSPRSLNIILPVGISFYTFQTLSYTIDIYKRKLEPTRDFIAFTAFVSFFPQLVAGPIERATNLLPQFFTQRNFDYQKSVDGFRQILWGLFKKVVIADNCAVYANMVFNQSDGYSGSTLIFGAMFFAFQIYGDFSGYSDIAIGTARLFGFNLIRNFNFPYFSRDIAEFWRKWHISLTSWFRDYIYIPLGGSRGGTWSKIRNTFIIFLLSGFWHGANWTFIIWGAVNALFFMPLLLIHRNRQNLDTVAQGKLIPSIRDIWNMGLTFALTTSAWIFFRANNADHAFDIFSEIFSMSILSFPELPKDALITLLLVGVFIVAEWIGREDQYAIEKVGLAWPRALRWGLYSMLIFLLGMFMSTAGTPFIYFQF